MVDEALDAAEAEEEAEEDNEAALTAKAEQGGYAAAFRARASGP